MLPDDADTREERRQRNDGKQTRHGHPLPRSWRHRLSASSPNSDVAPQAPGESSHAVEPTLRRLMRVGRHHSKLSDGHERPPPDLVLLTRVLTERSHECSITPSPKFSVRDRVGSRLLVP